MKYLITDTRYFIVEAETPEQAVEIYEDARDDFAEGEFEVEDESNEYTVQPMGSIN